MKQVIQHKTWSCTITGQYYELQHN